MYDLGNNFHIDLSKLRAKDEGVVKGEKYRFTVLTERLIRLEYSPNSSFNDLATQFVSFRDFDVPKFMKNDGKNTLEIETSYFKLEYQKEMPFKGSTFSPTKNLKVVVKNSNFVWYVGHPEAKNYYGSNVSAEVSKNETSENKGLYSDDGVVSFDDSNSLSLDELGCVIPPNNGNTDIYLFVYIS